MTRLSRMLLAVVAALALVAGVMPTAHADETTSTYIVELNNGLSAQAVIPSLLGSDAKVLTKAISGGVASLTAAQAKALEASPYVKSVRLDTQVATSTRPPVKTTAKVGALSLQTGAPWDLDILDSTTATLDGQYNPANDGGGVSVFVVDTGILRSHSEFANVTVAAGYDFVDGDTDPSDCDGQGTGVASLVAGAKFGVAKAATIVPLRVLDCEGSGYVSDLLSALDYVIAHHAAGTPAVVVIGLGSDVLTDLDTAVQNVIAAGVTVVVAADFQSVDACSSSPGRAPGAITVAASTSTNGEADGTSYGPCIDLYAPGQDVSIADRTGNTATATGSGTAYAAAVAAGVAAQILNAKPSSTPAQVWSRMSALAISNAVSIASHPSATPNALLSVRSTYESFVKASYQDFLGRQPSSGEVAAQAGALRTGSMSVGSFLTALSTSSEWLSAIVTKMYRDTLQRDPDPVGLAGWVSALRSGQWSVAQVAGFFYASDEYYSTYAGNSPAPWVTQLYQKLLGRSPDPLGLAQWVRQTNDPRYGRVWVAANFYQSTESRQKRVKALYQTLLSRDPDPTGWQYWTNTVLTTGDLVLATQIAGSQEYWQRAWARY